MAALPRSAETSLIPATARSLPIALLRARERVMQPVRIVLLRAGVTEAQWRVLRVLDEVGATDATEIARQACLLMPSLTRILQGLEEKGLTRRTPHPHDGRKQLVTITSDGTALIERHIVQANGIFAELEREFGVERIRQLLDLLNDLSRLER